MQNTNDSIPFGDTAKILDKIYCDLKERQITSKRQQNSHSKSNAFKLSTRIDAISTNIGSHQSSCNNSTICAPSISPNHQQHYEHISESSQSRLLTSYLQQIEYLKSICSFQAMQIDRLKLQLAEGKKHRNSIVKEENPSNKIKVTNTDYFWTANSLRKSRKSAKKGEKKNKVNFSRYPERVSPNKRLFSRKSV